MSLVLLAQALFLALRRVVELERPEVVEDRRPTPGEHLEALLWQLGRPIRDIGERADRAVLEADADHQVVAGLHRLGRAAESGGMNLGDRAAREEDERVEEVAALSDEAPAALLQIVDPVAWVDLPGTHPVDRGHRPSGHELAELCGVRGEAAIEPHREHALARLRRGDDLVELPLRESERLLAEDVLAGLEARRNELGVGTVPCRDDHGVHVVARDQLLLACRHSRETCLARCRFRREPRSPRHNRQARSGLGECRDQDGVGK